MTNLGDIGFIGTGTLTEAVVRGMRLRSPDLVIRLSPRSEAISRKLAAEIPGVIREASNADVVKNSRIVILAVRPQQLGQALKGLSFREEHIVVSFLAKTPVKQVAELVAPARQVCRVTPLPAIAERKGPIILFPSIPEVDALFDGLGDLVPAGSEDEIMDLGCASAMLSSFFEIEHAVASWLQKRGVSDDHASLYVRSMFAGLADTAHGRQSTPLVQLANEHETAGGLNEQARLHLRQAGVFGEIERVLDAVAQKAL